MAKKPSQTQQLLEAIYINHKCRSMAEAQEIYKKLYEVDKELDPEFAAAD